MKVKKALRNFLLNFEVLNKAFASFMNWANHQKASESYKELLKAFQIFLKIKATSKKNNNTLGKFAGKF